LVIVVAMITKEGDHRHDDHSLVAIDPGARHGVVIVEFHGFHNQVTNTRMHIELTPAVSDQWYSYWLSQFERIWQAAKVPAASQPGNT
jgi:hypothetical protein